MTSCRRSKQGGIQGPVYDLEVDKVHNYIARKWQVHNSLYSWREQIIGNILNFERDYPGCYRYLS